MRPKKITTTLCCLILVVLLSIFSIGVVSSTSSSSTSHHRKSVNSNNNNNIKEKIIYNIVDDSSSYSNSNNNDEDEDDLSLIISTLDGSIYSFHYQTGQLNWNINQGKALYSTSQTPVQETFSTGDSLVVPNFDGSGEFYQFYDGSIEKLPFTIHDIIKSSPIVSNGGGGSSTTTTTTINNQGFIEKTLFVGNKYTSILVVDTETGKVVKSMSKDGMWEEDCPSDVLDGTLLFTRSDYKILALDPKSGSEKWNISLGEYTPYSSEHTLSDSLIFEGLIEVLPLNNRYKLFVQKQKGIGSFWECVLTSTPISIHAYSKSQKILTKIDFKRRMMDKNNNQLILPNSISTDLVIPATFEPTFMFDQYEGQFFIASNAARNNNNNNNNRNNNSNNNNSNNNNRIPNNNNNNNNNRYISNGENDNQSNTYRPNRSGSTIDTIFDLIETNQAKLLMLSLIIIILSKSIYKRLIGAFNGNNNNSSNSNSNNNNNNNRHNNKTPKKKRKGKNNQNNNYHNQNNNQDSGDENNNNNNNNPIVIADPIPFPPYNPYDKKIILDNGNTKIGKLEITQNILGTGSCGTIVYEGFMEGRKVAIKRMLSQFIKFADREVSILIHSDEHTNVVRYYAKEEDGEFIYLALSYCKKSLDMLITETDPISNNNILNNNNRKIKNNNKSTITTTTTTTTTTVTTTSNISKTLLNDNKEISSSTKQMILELLQGLSHLHSLNILHRDIKPQNILIDPNGRVKISDMGLGKHLDRDDASLTFTSDSHGWQPAEYIDGTNRNTKKVDIFSIGCVIFYMLTGNNPFGQRFSREKNVIKGKYDIEAISHISDLHHLVSIMISHDPEKRPDITECIKHPFFWNTHKKLSFLVAASDYLEFEKPTSPLNLEIDSHIDEITGVQDGDWWAKIDQVLIDNIGRYRKYNGKSIRDLLRVIRNKFNHYRDLSTDEQNCLGALPDGFLHYFESKFPKLFITTFLFIEKNLKTEPYFNQFFDQK